MGICGPRWGWSLGLGLSQLGGTLHPTNFSFPQITLIGWRRLRIIEPWTIRGASTLLVVGSVRSSTVSS